MQGRLSEPIDGKIQAFPWGEWQDEFARAQALGLLRMEWTIDQVRLRENPLTTSEGQKEIKRLSIATGLKISSLTGDCFMQAPFWKSDKDGRGGLVRDLDLVLASAGAVGIELVVVPLVDNGRIDTSKQSDILLRVLVERTSVLSSMGVSIVFESDLPPRQLSKFIDRFPPEAFGINYDIGNSAALGYDCREEISAYASRILNVHVKDRLRGGTTVPLGSGAADLSAAVRLLERFGYRGQYILQTARAARGDHAAVLSKYRDMTARWIEACHR